MKKLILVLFAVLSSSAFASEADVGVNGMVCGFCAQGISKKFSKEMAVESVNVSLENKLVILKFKDGKDLSDDKISGILKDSGYSVSRIDRK